MAAYVIESYLPSAQSPTLTDLGHRASRAAAGLSTGSLTIRYLESIFMPSDEVCLHLFSAPNPELAAEAAGHAGIAISRVLEAVTTRGLLVGDDMTSSKCGGGEGDLR